MLDVDDVTALPIWQAADRLGVEVEAIYDLIFSGRVPHVRRPNGRPLVDPDDVLRVLTAQQAGPHA